MSVTQAENGTWEAGVWCKDWQGERKRKHKRGFATKREAKAWESAFIVRQDDSPDMRMHDFCELYREDRMPPSETQHVEDQGADYRDQDPAVLRRDGALRNHTRRHPQVAVPAAASPRQARKALLGHL